MKISVAQTRPFKGDIKRNIINHKKLIAIAVSHASDIIIFPELSISGYEPQLAKGLAMDKNDSRFDDFQQISDENKIIIGVGIPTKKDSGINITMILFQPKQEREMYSKKYLHADEDPFFIAGQNFTGLKIDSTKFGLALCYEISNPQHAEDAFNNDASIYIASVAKTVDGVQKANQILSAVAKKYTMTVLMSNCVGPSDNFVSDGRSAIWNNKGVLLAQLNNADEGILIIDTDTQEVFEKTI